MMQTCPTKSSEFTESTELLFYNIFKEMGHLDCSYMSYVYERSDGVRKHFFTDKIWLDTYIREGFIETCPLTLLGRDSDRIFIPWNHLNSLNNTAQLTMEARADMDITNGVTIIERVGNGKEMVALATRRNNPKFYQNLMGHGDFVKRKIIELRKSVINTDQLIN